MEPGGPVTDSVWFLRMDAPGGEAFRIPGVDGTPIFSPDSRWIAFTKVVPLKEAADVMGFLPGRLAVSDLLDEVNRSRDPRTYLSKGWDVADPYKRKLRDYRRAVAEIDELVGQVVGRLL
mgnify:CR=1 FL=1